MLEPPESSDAVVAPVEPVVLQAVVEQTAAVEQAAAVVVRARHSRPQPS